MTDATIGITVDPRGAERGAESVRRSLSTLAREATTTQRAMTWMMASIANDSRRAADALSRNTQTIQNEVSRTSLGVGELTGAFRNLIGIVGAGLGLRAIIRETILAEDSFAKLEAVLKAVGGRISTSAEEWKDYALQLQSVSRYSDEAVMDSVSLMATMEKIGEQVIPEAIKQSANLAALMGSDLPSAARMLGRTLNDPTQGLTMMRRAGIQFTDTQQILIKGLFEAGKEAQAQEMILKILEGRVGGLSEKMRDTLGGALDHLKNSFSDLLEGEGKGLNAAKDSINGLAETLKDPAVKEGFKTFTSGVLEFAGAVATLAAKFALLPKNIAEKLGQLASGSHIGNVSTVAEADAKIKAIRENQAQIGSRTDLSDYEKQRQMALYQPALEEIERWRQVLQSAEKEAEKAAKATTNAAKAAKELGEETGHGDAVMRQANESLSAWNARLSDLIGAEAARKAVMQAAKDATQLNADALEKAYVAAKPVVLAEEDMARTMEHVTALRKLGLVTIAEETRLKAKLKLQVDELRYAETHAFEQFMASVDPVTGALEKLRQQIAQLHSTTKDPIEIKLAIQAMSREFDPAAGLGSAQAGIERDTRVGGLTKLQGATNDQDEIARLEALKTAAGDTYDFIIQKIAEAGLTNEELLVKSLNEVSNSLMNLGNVMGATGQQITGALGGMVGGFLQIAEAQDDVRRAQEAVNELTAKGAKKNTPEYINATKKLDMAQRDATKAQLRGYGDLASSAAGFFDEGSKGYKTLQAVSSAFHAAEMIMNIAELTMKAKIAIATQATGDPYSAFARMAMMAAAMAALGAMVSGGGGGGQRGGKAGRGVGTVLGSKDPSESIGNAMSQLEDLQSAELSVSHSMLLTLRSIDAAIRGVGLTIAQNKAISGQITPEFRNMEGSLQYVGIELNPEQTIGAIQRGNELEGQFARLDGLANYQFAVLGETGDEFAGVIRQMADAAVQAVEYLGLDAEEAIELLNNMELGIEFISTRGLSGEEIQERLAAVFSSLGDRMAQLVAPEILQFQRVGEGLLETLIRIASETNALTVALSDMGVAFEELDLITRIEVGQQLIALAGGIENLSSSLSDFNEAFFTEEERMMFEAAKLVDVFNEFGYAMPSTRDGVRDIVEGLDLTTTSGQEAFVVLTSMSDRMDQFYSFWEGREEERLDLLIEEADNLKALADQYHSTGAALHKFVDSLFVSAQSPLTPQQRLADAQSQFAMAFDAAMNGDIESAGQLQQLANTVLSLARDVFASSPDYTAIFGSITESLEQVAGTYDAITPEELMVDGLYTANEELVRIRSALLASGLTLDAILAALVTTPTAPVVPPETLEDVLNDLGNVPVPPTVPTAPTTPTAPTSPIFSPERPWWEEEVSGGRIPYGPQPLPRAFGGPIWGAGGPFDDRVPVLASAGEFMMNSSAVDRYGMAMMHSINSGAFGLSGASEINLDELIYEVQQLRRQVAESDAPINLKIVTPDERTLVDKVLTVTKERSRRGEAVVYIQGVVQK